MGLLLLLFFQGLSRNQELRVKTTGVSNIVGDEEAVRVRDLPKGNRKSKTKRDIGRGTLDENFPLTETKGSGNQGGKGEEMKQIQSTARFWILVTKKGHHSFGGTQEGLCKVAGESTDRKVKEITILSCMRIPRHVLAKVGGRTETKESRKEKKKRKIGAAQRKVWGKAWGIKGQSGRPRGSAD